MPKLTSLNLAILRNQKPKRYLVDPLEYFAVRIATITPLPISSDLVLALSKVHLFLQDDDLPTSWKQAFIASLREYCTDEIMPALVNVHWLMKLLEPETPLIQSTIEAWKGEGLWDRIEHLATTYFDKAAAAQAANPQLAANAQKLSHLYYAPSMKGGRFPVISGPQEQATRDQAHTLMKQGMAAETEGEFHLARDCYAQAAELLPRDYEMAFAHANIYLRLGEPQVSINLFRELCQAAPRSAKYLSAYGSALAKSHLNEEALEKLEEALRLEPGRSATVVNKILVLQRLGRYTEAANLIFESFADDSPMQVAADLSPAAYHGVLVAVVAAADSDQFDTAERLSKILCELNPSDPEAWERRADVAVRRASQDDALAYYEKALNLDSDRTSTIKKCISLAKSAPLTDRIIELTRKYLSIKPDDSYIWNDLGTVFGASSRFEEAENCFRMAVKHDPNDSLHWTNLGGILLQTRRTRKDVLEGIECLDRALMIDPDHLGAQFNRAAALLMLDDFEAAENSFLKILQEQPDFPQVSGLLEFCKQERARLQGEENP